MSARATTSAVGDAWITNKSRWFFALGIVLVVLGTVALLDVVSITLATAIVVSASRLAGGVFQIIHALMTRERRRFFFGLLSGPLYVAGGLAIMREPVQGAVVPTLALAALIVASVGVGCLLYWNPGPDYGCSGHSSL